MYFYFFSFFLLQLGLQNIPFPLATTNSLSVPFYICICKKKKRKITKLFISFTWEIKSHLALMSLWLWFSPVKWLEVGACVSMCTHICMHKGYEEEAKFRQRWSQKRIGYICCIQQPDGWPGSPQGTNSSREEEVAVLGSRRLRLEVSISFFFWLIDWAYQRCSPK